MSLAQAVAERALGRDAGLLRLQSAGDNRLVCAHMLEQTRRELCLLSHYLDKPVFDQEAFLRGVRALALHGRHSRIRILLHDHGPAVKQGHRLVELIRRLSSSIEIRIPGDDWRDLAENFLLADGRGFVHRELGTRYEATADYHAPLRVRLLRARFDDIWETAQSDPELRRLYI
jgi:hypothetical protein